MIRTSRTQQIMHLSAAHQSFDQGVDLLVAAIAPTLGPIPNTVAIQRAAANMSPEILDNGATIARRITSLSDASTNIGAMYLRGLLHRIFTETGDGTATAAVIFSAVLRGGRRAIAAGIPAQLLRQHLDQLADVVSRGVLARSTPCTIRTGLQAVASATCPEEDLASLLADVFDVLGPYGQLDTRPGHTSETWHEFVRGAYWDAGRLLSSSRMDQSHLREGGSRSAILVSDIPLTSTDDVVAILKAFLATGRDSLLIITPSLTPDVSGILHTNAQHLQHPIMAVKPPVGSHMLEDIALLTNAQPLLAVAGHTLGNVRPEILGRARSIWSTSTQFGFIGGESDLPTLRGHVDTLVRAHRTATTQDDRQRIEQRLGKTHGISATIRVGGATAVEEKHLTNLLTQSARTVRSAMLHGTVPGAGSTLLQIGEHLDSLAGSPTDDISKHASQIVKDALRAPVETIMKNVGKEWYLANQDHLAAWLDSAQVVATAARAAIRAAALALTIDVTIHPRSPEQTVLPE